MKKLRVILAAIFLLVACGCTTDGWVIEKARNICKEKGGVSSLFHFDNYMVRCMDGSKTKIDVHGER